MMWRHALPLAAVMPPAAPHAYLLDLVSLAGHACQAVPERPKAGRDLLCKCQATAKWLQVAGSGYSRTAGRKKAAIKSALIPHAMLPGSRDRGAVEAAG